MKSKFLVAFLLLAIVGCKKETARLTDDIQGKWELVSYDGAWVGHVDYAPGNGNTYIFSGNNFTQQYKSADTTIQTSGTFKIYTGKPCDSSPEQTLIDFNGTYDLSSSFSLTDGKLMIGTNACIADGGTGTYRKISN